MTEKIERVLDKTGWQILKALHHQARLSYRELGQKVGLSAPAASERVRKLEETGVITGYHAEIDLARAGFPITAIVRMGIAAGQSSARVTKALSDFPEVLECFRVTGSDTFILKVGASSVEHLQEFIDQALTFGPVTTSIVLSIPVKKHILTPEMTAMGKGQEESAP